MGSEFCGISRYRAPAPCMSPAIGRVRLPNPAIMDNPCRSAPPSFWDTAGAPSAQPIAEYALDPDGHPKSDARRPRMVLRGGRGRLPGSLPQGCRLWSGVRRSTRRTSALDQPVPLEYLPQSHLSPGRFSGRVLRDARRRTRGAVARDPTASRMPYLLRARTSFLLRDPVVVPPPGPGRRSPLRAAPVGVPGRTCSPSDVWRSASPQPPRFAGSPGVVDETETRLSEQDLPCNTKAVRISGVQRGRRPLTKHGEAYEAASTAPSSPSRR